MQAFTTCLSWVEMPDQGRVKRIVYLVQAHILFIDSIAQTRFDTAIWLVSTSCMLHHGYLIDREVHGLTTKGIVGLLSPAYIFKHSYLP